MYATFFPNIFIYTRLPFRSFAACLPDVTQEDVANVSRFASFHLNVR